MRIVANARLLVAVVSARQLKEPRAGDKPLFRAVVQDKLSFRVSIAEAGDYLVVLSNRGGKQAVTVQAEVRATRRAPKPKAPRAPSETRAALDPGRDAVARIW